MARKLAPDKWLFAATTGLALFGVVMVYSASAVLAERENGNQFFYVLKQGVWVFIGFIVMLLMMQFNYQQLKNRRLVYALLFLTILALMIVFDPDLVTAMMLALIFLVMIYTAGARLKHLALAAAPALIVVAGLLIFV